MSDEHRSIPEQSNSNACYLLLMNISNINWFHLDQPFQLQIKENEIIKNKLFLDLFYYL